MTYSIATGSGTIEVAGEKDAFTSIESFSGFLGSAFDDYLFGGTANDNNIDGGAGNALATALPDYLVLKLDEIPTLASTLQWLFNEAFDGTCGREAVMDRLFELVVTLLFILASLTLGLIISTRATTQLQAMQMTVFILLPSILLSGFMFPYAAMPVAAQWLAEVLPATHFVRMIRAVVLRDAQWWTLSYDVAYLAGFTMIGLVVATLRFKKRLD